MLRVITLLFILMSLWGSTSVASERTQYTMNSDGPLPESQKGLVLDHADLHFQLFPKTKSISGRGILTLISEQPRTEIGINLDNFF